jgi:hypothetical protein
MSTFDGEVERLERALGQARRQWDATCTVWRDDVQREFAERHWSLLENAAQDVIQSLATLSGVVQDIERRMQ